MVPVSSVTGNEEDSDMVYFILEKPIPDTGKTLRWKTAENSAVSTINTMNAGVYETIDTAPPRIDYMLTVPGVSELYVKLTEKVTGFQRTMNGKLGEASFNAWQKAHEDTAGEDKEFLVSLGKPFGGADIASGALYWDSVFAPLRDTAPNAIPVTSFVSSVNTTADNSPKFPVDYNYKKYVRAQGISGEKLISGTSLLTRVSQPNSYQSFDKNGLSVNDTGLRRASDALIMTNIPQYRSTWPEYVQDKFAVEPGTARKFDGTERLRNTELSMMLSPAAPSFLPRVRYTLTGTSGSGSNADAVWLLGDEKTGLNLKPFTKALNPPAAAAASGNKPLYLYTIPEAEVQNGQTLSFIFDTPFEWPRGRLSPLYGVRLNTVNGAVPRKWYQSLAPFTVHVMDIVRQRSGATILNNVIYPDRGEKAFLDYRITKPGPVTIQVFTLDGNLVRQLERSGSKAAGEYVVEWDGKNSGGRVVARGMYFIRIVAPDIDEIRKVEVVR
jgi:hypothetical protein